MSRSRSRSAALPEGATLLRGGMEALIVGLVVGLPWAFGGVDPIHELIVAGTVAALTVMWASIACLNGRLSWSRCPITILLAGLVLFCAFQLVPLPGWILRIASPTAAELNADLLPTEPEIIAAGIESPPMPGMRPISVYPHVTRIELFHLLQVLVVFAIVRHQVASTVSMRRLALAALLTGVAISLYGLFQYFRNGGHKVYGFETLGTTFGPFINRNHAACFLNMCIGLGIGLLVQTSADASEYKRRHVQKPNAMSEQADAEAAIFSPLSVLHSPTQLWILVALTIMAAGVICTFSRGGVACLGLSLCFAFAARLRWPPRVGRLEFLILPVILLVALFAWVGIRPLESRLADLWNQETLTDTRWPIWLNILRLVPSFLIFGSGNGTLGYIEPIARQQSELLEVQRLFVDHAHNDYLEALVEGGLIRFALTVALVLLVVGHGVRALRRFERRTPGAFAFGGLIGVTALAFHSFVDFSVQTPAIACLGIVLAAQLVALNRPDPTVPPSGAHARMVTLRFSTPGLVVLAAGSLGLGAVLIAHAWRADQVFRYRVGAFRAMQRAKLPDPEMAIQYLLAASDLSPRDAELRVELGQFYLNSLQPQSPRFSAEALFPGMQQMIAARNICPLLPRPHLRLAVFAPKLERADPPIVYWKRAERLAPFDPDLWYLHGVQLLRDKKPADAYSCWKTSLVLSPRHLPQILDAGLPILGVDGLIAHVLPDDPELMVKAATRLESLKPPPNVVSLYKKAYELLNARTNDLTPADYYLRARCAEQLGDTDGALKAYKQALLLSELQHEWRWRFAKLLHRAGKLQEALRELTRLRQVFPDNREIQDEYDLVGRELEIQP